MLPARDIFYLLGKENIFCPVRAGLYIMDFNRAAPCALVLRTFSALLSNHLLSDLSLNVGGFKFPVK